jgi:glucosamine--fructose-6-phosphate aminotransferase (isomerizing)
MTIMAAEIREVPSIVRTQLTTAAASFEAVAEAIRAAKPDWVSIVARGTSDHAAIYARYLIETQLGWPVGLASPSVTTLYHAPTKWANGLVLAVSQSGRSPDLVAVVEAARRGGALTVAVTNAPDSPLEAAASLGLRCTAGEERAVAATKSYVAELAAVARIVASLAPASELAGALPRVPDVLAETLSAAEAWLVGAGRELVAAIATAGRALVVSRGYNLATALETALKLKETGRIFAEGYSAADLEHGPIALAIAGFPTLAFRPDGPIGAAIDPAAERSRSLGARTWVVGGLEVAGQPDALSVGALADLPECLTPLALILPGQLLAEAVAVRLRLSPDAPTGLHKVTLTR